MALGVWDEVEDGGVEEVWALGELVDGEALDAVALGKGEPHTRHLQ